MSTAFDVLAERVGNELADSIITVFKGLPEGAAADLEAPTCEHVAAHEDYYMSRLMHAFNGDFSTVVFRALEECVRRNFNGAVVSDVLKYILCSYPTAREQVRLLLDSRELPRIHQQYDAVALECAQYCTCYRHYEWTPPGSAKDSGSVTPGQCSTEPESPLLLVPPVVAPPLAPGELERDLEEFLARANLSQLNTVLHDARMWLDILRSIPLGQLHNELLPLVPHRAHRQRLIDALHSTIDIRSSHKEKQGMWLKARDEGRTIYIRGIEGLTDFELREYLCTNHGPTVDMRYMFDPRNNSFMGYGFVLFEHKSAVDSILRRTSYQLRDNVTITVKCSDDLKR